MATTTIRRVPNGGPHDLKSGNDGCNGNGYADNFDRFRPTLEGVHKSRESLLSKPNGWETKRGGLNAFIILVVLSNIKAVRENFHTHGILVDPLKLVRNLIEPGAWPPILVLIGINMFILFSLMMERLISKGTLSERFGIKILAASMASLLLAPAGVIITWRSNLLVAVLVLCLVVALFLKLVSYHAVNFWCRERKAGKAHYRRKSSAGLNGTSNGHQHPTPANGVIQNGCLKRVVVYPDNLTLQDIYYFVFTPTLCYELNFPRSPTIRKEFLLRGAVNLSLFLALAVSMLQQFMLPVVQNSPKSFQDMSLGEMMEQLLQVLVPNMMMWIVIFFLLFHTILNMTAEVLRFGDRQFYRDWWNAETVRYFWRTWNIPVHQWCMRHLYNPLLCKGLSSRSASTLVFLISAVLHEYVVSVPIGTLRLWAFAGMALQIPVSRVIDEYVGIRFPVLAGFLVWVSFASLLTISNLPYYHYYYNFS